MAKGITAKSARGGRAVTATIPLDRLRSIIASLPEGEDRSTLATALEAADGLRTSEAREARLRTPLSIESLMPLGWMATGTVDAIAYGAIREGDFRLDQRAGRRGWVFGPPGAFDRELEGTTILRGATQAGVMSETHWLYLMAEPTIDRQAAIAEAERLEAEWRARLPKRRARPDALGRPARLHLGSLSPSCWSSFYAKGERDLPDGAVDVRLQQGVDNAYVRSHHQDDVATDGRSVVRVFECDATLRPVRSYSLSRDAAPVTTVGMDWSVSLRRDDPTRPLVDECIQDGPYDCVLGRVWVAVAIPFGSSHGRPMLRITEQSGAADWRDAQAFPLDSREKADVAAGELARRVGLREGDPFPLPEAIPAPAFQEDLALAA